MIETGPYPVLEDNDSVAEIKDYSEKMLAALAKTYHASYAGTFNATANTLTKVGNLARDNAKSKNDAFVSLTGPGEVTFSQTGVYAITQVNFPANNPGNAFALAKDVANVTKGKDIAVNGLAWECIQVIPNLVVAAVPYKLTFSLQTAATVSVNASLEITKIQG